MPLRISCAIMCFGGIDLDYKEIMDRLTTAYQRALSDNFVGMYVHGSIAMGCFNPLTSDIDYICIVNEEPDDAQKKLILDATLEMDAYAPQKGLEMHIMRLRDCIAPRHPAYFCLHYSRAHTHSVLNDPQEYIARMKGFDPDLGGHLTIMHACGVRWAGPPVADVFGPVPKEMYLESILEDVLSDCGDEIYRICNLCRVWGYLAEGLVLSKRTGPEWALRHETDHRETIREALACYNEGRAWNSAHGAEKACAYLKGRIISLLPDAFKEKYA